MTNKLLVNLEIGPKLKRVVAVAPDWPGLERGGKTEAEALDKIHSYLPRYERVANLAGLRAEFATIDGVEVVERYQGIGSTDFWGISFAFSTIDKEEISSEDLKRELSLMRACWKRFDLVRARVSAEMKKGPRGGGRDRDRIILHTMGVEQDWAKKVGVKTPEYNSVPDAEVIRAYRNTYCAAVRAFHSEGKPARNWPLRFLIRHTAFHTMDHTWEMEDNDLTDPSSS